MSDNADFYPRMVERWEDFGSGSFVVKAEDYDALLRLWENQRSEIAAELRREAACLYGGFSSDEAGEEKAKSIAHAFLVFADRLVTRSSTVSDGA